MAVNREIASTTRALPEEALTAGSGVTGGLAHP